jgi:hypothetical protein
MLFLASIANIFSLLIALTVGRIGSVQAAIWIGVPFFFGIERTCALASNIFAQEVGDNGLR